MPFVQDGAAHARRANRSSDALAVCTAFNTTNRLADTFGFEAGAKVLLKRGYR